MRKLSYLLVVAMVFGLSILPGVGAMAQDLTIGVVIPYEIGWFSAFREGFELIADKENVRVTWQYHNYQADQETNAIQNLIVLGVDAINLTAVTPSSAEYSCRLANEAGIPIQITESGIAEGSGKPVADIDFDWFDVYNTVANSLRNDLEGDLSVVMIQGFAGTPPVMQGIQGFKEAIQELEGIALATDVQYGDYATAPSLDIMKTLVQAGLEFNVAIGASQEITEGIIQGLREENVDLDEVAVVSVNGGPMDIENLRRGYLDFVLSLSPGLHGMICAQNLINYMKGEPYQEKSYSPIAWCTRDNWEEILIPWYLDASWFPVVEEFVRSGEYKPELRS
ncbi:MAG TPA: sugar ABC transporter substrate-binding protein [Atribacteraceae bacterium]|nr:sugar ABC transporter substrate-binding protein [Atribacteraceae bacterium]